MSLACISDHNEHNAITIYGFLQVVLKYLREKLPAITKIFYFSDGCAGQYKNFKDLAKISHHNNDFGLDAEWQECM